MGLSKVSCALLLAFGFCLQSAFAQSFMVPPDTDPQVINAFNEGSQLLGAGQAAEAVKKLEIVIKALPNMAVAHYNYGIALGKTGKLNESVQELEKAVQLDPSNEGAIVNLGTTYQLAGRNSDALATYKKYLASFPNGAFVKQVSVQSKSLEAEVKRSHGQSSRGLDNYLSETMAGRGGRWEPSSMPLNVFIQKGSGEGYRDEFTDILKKSFLDWEQASQGKISIRFVESPKNALIKCSWTDNPRDLDNPIEGGKAEVMQTPQGQIMKAEILILTVNKKLTDAFSVDYMKHVCLHEIGHAMGLAGHSSGPEDMMFASANPEAASTALSDRDKKTILMLYSGSR